MEIFRGLGVEAEVRALRTGPTGHLAAALRQLGCKPTDAGKGVRPSL
jgi:hypothetical protein